jgi:hypothetical protein
MDHEAGRKPIASGQSRFSGGTAADGAALGQQFGAGRPVDGPVHAAAAQQGGVGRIDDGIDFQSGNIALPNFDPGSNGGIHGFAPDSMFIFDEFVKSRQETMFVTYHEGHEDHEAEIIKYFLTLRVLRALRGENRTFYGFINLEL